jgi:gluconate 2-dehydrogenase gamma chain
MTAGSGLASEELELLAAIVDRLAPADAVGPGAVELGVVEYVAGALAHAGAPRADEWRHGLAAVDACARARHGSGFAALAPQRRDAILADLEHGRAGTDLADEAAFFALVRDHLLQGMFCDPSWGGNRGAAGWGLLSYPGPRFVWGEAEQRLDALPGPARVGDA